MIGCLESDFAEQLHPETGLDRSEFTLVAVDLLGYGRSRPPEKEYRQDIYHRDGDAALKVMDHLGYRTFSILGWSDGGKVGLTMAIRYRSKVDKLAIWGTLSYATPEDVALVVRTKDLTKWDPAVKKRYEEAYGSEVYARLWGVYISYCERVGTEFKWDLREELPKIRSSTLVLHGDRDPMIIVEHPKVNCKLIPDSRLHRFADGSHNIHQTHTAEFNEIVSAFFLE